MSMEPGNKVTEVLAGWHVIDDLSFHEESR